MRLSLALSALLLFPAGCSGDYWDKDAAGDGCVWTSSAVALDEVTELGLSASDLLAQAEGEHSAVFTYAAGETTPLSLTVTGLGTAELLTGEAPESNTDVYWDCPTTLSVDVRVDFLTEDGAFAEQWDTALINTAESQGVTAFSVELDPDGLSGSYDLTSAVTSTDYDELIAWGNGRFEAAGPSGEISGQASGSEECDDGETCSAWAELVEVGAWAAAAE